MKKMSFFASIVVLIFAMACNGGSQTNNLNNNTTNNTTNNNQNSNSQADNSSAPISDTEAEKIKYAQDIRKIVADIQSSENEYTTKEVDASCKNPIQGGILNYWLKDNKIVGIEFDTQTQMGTIFYYFQFLDTSLVYVNMNSDNSGVETLADGSTVKMRFKIEEEHFYKDNTVQICYIRENNHKEDIEPDKTLDEIEFEKADECNLNIYIKGNVIPIHKFADDLIKLYSTKKFADYFCK